MNDTLNISTNTNIQLNEWIKTPSSYYFYDKYLDLVPAEIKEYYKRPIGLYDPLGNNINPLTNEPYQNFYKHEKITLGPVIGKDALKGTKVPMTYKTLSYAWSNLLAFHNIDPILESIRNNQITLVKAGTGTGKTVIVPKLAAQAFNFQKKVICTIPKKKITYSAAEYAAKCLDVRLGEEVGYYYKGTNKTSEKTKIVYSTTGSLISKITRDDPYLTEYSCIIMDEAHERSIQTDELFLFIKKALQKNDNLKLVIMSATINLDKFRNYFPTKQFSFSEVDAGSETIFNITDYYEPISVKDWRVEAVNKVEKLLLDTTQGDIMVFIRSAGDGNMICNELRNRLHKHNSIRPFCSVLEGKTPESETAYIINEVKYLTHPNMPPNKPYTRKVIMSTNVAESSLTVKGIVYVIDSGRFFEEMYFPEENANGLVDNWISRSAVMQRRGRGGRTQDGVCYHLYTKEEEKKFNEYPIPDIQKSDLTSDILDIMKLEYIKNIKDVRTLLAEMIDPPEERFIASALHNLYALEAITSEDLTGELTQIGHAMSNFRSMKPNYAKAILMSYYLHCKNEVIDILSLASLIDSRIDNIFNTFRPSKRNLSPTDLKKEAQEYEKKQKKFHDSEGDYMTLYKIITAYHTAIKKNNSANVKKWFITNGIRYDKFKYMVSDAKQVANTLFKIVQPADLKKAYYNKYRNNGGVESINNLNQSIKNNKAILVNNNQMGGVSKTSSKLSSKRSSKKNNINNKKTKKRNSINNNKVSKSSSKSSSKKNNIYNKNINKRNTINNNKKNNKSTKSYEPKSYELKPYELNLFPNILPFDNKYNNIMYCLAVGNIINISKLINKNKRYYKSCFPLKHMMCQPDKSSTIKVLPQVVMYDELFMSKSDQILLKMNVVNKIPQQILSKLKTDYPLISKCFTKNNNSSFVMPKKPKYQFKQKFKQPYKQKFKYQFKRK